MTDEDIKTAARAAELADEQDWYGKKIVCAMWAEDVDLLPALRRFAAAVEAAERERCAKLCENYAQRGGLTVAEELSAKRLADALRA
jgi:hypothetical protein